MAEKKRKLPPNFIKILDEALPELGRMRELQQIYNFILELSVKSLRASGGTFFVIDAGMASLVPKASIGIPLEQLAKLPFKYGVGVCGWVAHKQEPLLINDVSKDSRFNKLYDKFTGYRTQSILCAPMPLHNGLSGVIELINHAEHRFTIYDLVFLNVLSGHAISSLEKAV